MSSDSDLSVKTVREALVLQQKHPAANAFISAMAKDQSAFITSARKNGLFRCSNYSFSPNLLEHLLAMAETSTPTIALSTETTAYFNSLRALYFIARPVHKLFRSFLDGLNTGSMKSYLAATDQLFWFPELELSGDSLRQGSGGYATEEIATAFSYYFYHLVTRHKPESIPLGHVYEEKTIDGFYLEKLKTLCGIGKFREAEIMVDAFNYHARRRGPQVTIAPPSPLMEQSIRLGYIHSINQHLSDSGKLKLQIHSLSLETFCAQLLSKAGDLLIHVKEKPIPRIVMALPDVKYTRDLISGNHVFQEEAIQLALTQKELLIQPNQLYDAPISGSLTIFDILKFQRLFRLLLGAFRQHIDKNNLRSDPLFCRSMIPVYDRAVFQQHLEGFFGPTKATEILNLFTWDPTSQRVFDLQTQPILACGKWLAIPIGVVAGSNLVRNVLIHNRFRFDSTSDADPVGDELATAFSAVLPNVRRNITYSFQGSKGEVDFMCRIGDHLFAFECKNSLHPCNPFELRTIYDYIQKASTQLNQFQQLFQNLAFRSYLAAKTGLQLPDEITLHTAIVTGNRMFSGWSERGQPVRALYELCNMVTSGILTFRASDSKSITRALDLSLWTTDQFQVNDFINYIDNSSFHHPRFAAMDAWQETVPLGGKKLVFDTFLMNPEKEVKNLLAKYRWRQREEPNPFLDSQPPQDSDRLVAGQQQA